MLDEPATQFAALVSGSARWEVRAELADDAGFLYAMYCSNAPLAAVLPPSLLDQQHRVQEGTFRAQHPDAMHSILLRAGVPVGRIIIDWSGDGPVHGVDIAVRADGGGNGGGLVMLKAWLAVADRLGRDCTLSVVASNPARRLYRHLGFAEVADQPADAPVLAMARRRGGN